MTTKESINVPGATAILTLRDETDKPFAEGTSYFATMKMIKDLGMQFPAEKSKRKKHYALYECPNCKKPFRAVISVINAGIIKSCRCKTVERFIKYNTTHGLYKHPLRYIYGSMIQRCFNPNSPNFKHYGGRGISVCLEWKNSFISFYEWAVNNGYSKGLVIDRENNDLSYSPSNCRWINRYISGENTRLITIRNKSGYRGVCYFKGGKRNRRCFWQTS